MGEFLESWLSWNHGYIWTYPLLLYIEQKVAGPSTSILPCGIMPMIPLYYQLVLNYLLESWMSAESWIYIDISKWGISGIMVIMESWIYLDISSATLD